MSNSNGSSSSAFELLDDGIKKWIWKQGWDNLRDIQESAIPTVLGGNKDLIIASPTASGKTEAAILPILSKAVSNKNKGVFALYLAPLKALINDQYRRFCDIADEIEVQITPWHGDISRSKKKKLITNPSGLLLITPESLESLFVNHGTKLKHLFGDLSYLVIDELHSFIGNERGRHLKTLIDRLELTIGRTIPRIGLSATIGDKNLAKKFLRESTKSEDIQYIESSSFGTDLKLQLRGYILTDPNKEKDDEQEAKGNANLQIATHLFKHLRGSDNLIFANSRANVEEFAVKLREMSEEFKVPNEFWPHHGSLSKELRETVESELKDNNKPSTAVCTSTLEMGIDIGTVDSIAQIGSPPSVASMRQRLGRSGRRGNPAIMRIYIAENEITEKTAPQDCLRTELFQSTAMVELLTKKWFEPPNLSRLHLSTLIHQLLSLIGQYGGVRAMDAWAILFNKGPFSGMNKSQFADLLQHLGKQEVITQVNDGTLTLGVKGEHILDHYSFYAAFNTPDEYKVIAGGKNLGTIPILFPLVPGTYIIFAGKRWIIQSVDEDKRLVVLSHSAGGKPPMFNGGGLMIHDKIREEMLELYKSKYLPPYLDAGGESLLREGREYFDLYGLKESNIYCYGDDVLLFIWKGSRVQNTILLLLKAVGLDVGIENTAIIIRNVTPDLVNEKIREIVTNPIPDPITLVEGVANKKHEKFDYMLTDELLNLEYYNRFIEIDKAIQYFEEIHNRNGL